MEIIVRYSPVPVALSMVGRLSLMVMLVLTLVLSGALSGAPLPARTGTLDLAGRKLLFDEDFRQLSVSARGPGTQWIAHTPWGGDFGDAAFADPEPGFPFGVTDGVFHIELRRNAAGTWQSGLLATQDPQGNGFAARYGYFEMRAKLPPGPGTWPGFWLDAMTPQGSPDPSVEVDVIEQYGKFPGNYNSTVTVWPKPGHGKPDSHMHINTVASGTMAAAYHTYGVDVGPEWIVFYMDREETWRIRTPVEHTHPLMILVDLALGSGWPIDQTPSPSFMDIDYIRVFAPVAAPPLRITP
jgi:hypothetical protein